MIYSNNTINNECCVPILALAPFTSNVLNVGEQGRTGLSGPNVELIAFNSGDFNFSDLGINAMVGLGVTDRLPVSAFIPRSELGIVILHQCTLSNFEIAFSGSGLLGQDGFVRYDLLIFRSAFNSGVDYVVPGNITAFSGTFNIIDQLMPSGPISRNTLITTPFTVNNNIAFPGDRLVLLLVKGGFVSEFFEVSASIQCTPF